MMSCENWWILQIISYWIIMNSVIYKVYLDSLKKISLKNFP
jgi:hypothetical protein